jgi:hypothetical protein
MTLAGMCLKYREIYLLVVSAIGQFLVVINVAMLRALVTEVLRLTKQQNVGHPVKNTVRCFKLPALWPAGYVWHVFLQQFKHLHGYGMEFVQSHSSETKTTLLNIPQQCSPKAPL